MDISRLENEADAVERFDAELLDELITSRGELKLRTVSFSEERKGQVCISISNTRTWDWVT